jgi:hypothetical protein
MPARSEESCDDSQNLSRETREFFLVSFARARSRERRSYIDTYQCSNSRRIHLCRTARQKTFSRESSGKLEPYDQFVFIRGIRGCFFLDLSAQFAATNSFPAPAKCGQNLQAIRISE